MPRRFYVLLTLATLAGASLRLWRLTTVPPGLHYDLAATALLGNAVAFGGYRPIFITAYTGHEVLFYYWLALWFRLIGSSLFALRLAAALIGILTIPAAFFAIREALRFEEGSPILAAFAATFLAFTFFHVTFSRFGFRVIAEPLIQSLALGFLFRGLYPSHPSPFLIRNSPFPIRNSQFRIRPSPFPIRPSQLRIRPSPFIPGHWSNFLLAGAFTGLAAYTYLAARLFPVPLAAFWLALLLGSLRPSQFLIRNSQFPIRPSPFALYSFLLFSLSASLTFAPLGLYFLRHPDDFLNRASQVTPRPGETALLLQGFRRAAEMIFVNGEPYDRFNLPGLPLFGPLLGSFFVVGLLITMANLIRSFRHQVALSPGYRVARPNPHTPTLNFATELLLLTWLPAMLLPTALSVHDIFPSNVRAFGLIPLLFVFPARGLLASYRWLQARLPGPMIPHPYPLTLLCLITLVAGTLTTGQQYFVTWASLPNQRLNNDADLTAIADYLNRQDLRNTAVFVSAIHYRHPTLAYLARDFDSIHWLTGGTSLVIPGPAGSAALYVFPRSAPPPEEWIASWGSHLVAAPLGPAAGNVPDFRAYRFAAGESPPLPEFTSLNENFGNIAALTGYGIHLHPDDVTVDLRWRIENLPQISDLLPYARLYDAWGTAWSQSGGFTYPSEQWSPGDMLITRVTAPLPAGLPPGHYTLKAGMYSASSQTSLPHLDAGGRYAGDRAVLTEVDLTGGASAEVADFLTANPMSMPVRNLGLDRDLALLGHTLNTTTPRQGERINLTLFWHTAAPLSAESLTITLGDRPLFTGPPVHGTFPFSEWTPGQWLTDRYSLKVPPDFPAGPAGLGINVPGYGSAALTPLDIQKVERSFTAAPASHVVAYDFNHTLSLYGYDLTPGAMTSLTLYWKSLATLEADQTVFVHVLDASGQIVAQADAQPRGGAYPTSLWVPGEFVTDPYTFHLPPGTYVVEVGLYLPETGARLPIFDSSGKPFGDAATLPAFQVP